MAQIGQLISDAMDRVGRQGVVTMEESRTAEDHLYVVEGMQFDRGYISPYFVTDPERMVRHSLTFLVQQNMCRRWDSVCFRCASGSHAWPPAGGAGQEVQSAAGTIDRRHHSVAMTMQVAELENCRVLLLVDISS